MEVGQLPAEVVEQGGVRDSALLHAIGSSTPRSVPENPSL
jgi:hypothetical protein